MLVLSIQSLKLLHELLSHTQKGKSRKGSRKVIQLSNISNVERFQFWGKNPMKVKQFLFVYWQEGSYTFYSPFKVYEKSVFHVFEFEILYLRLRYWKATFVLWGVVINVYMIFVLIQEKATTFSVIQMNGNWIKLKINHFLKNSEWNQSKSKATSLTSPGSFGMFCLTSKCW